MSIITGSWFEFRHHNVKEGKYWNDACTHFNCGNWDKKIKEISNAGLDTLVLMAVALDGKTFYKSSICPGHDSGCVDPLEDFLTATDKYEMNVFVGNGFWEDWASSEPCINDESIRTWMDAFRELEKYSRRFKSFKGWYWPTEAHISPYFTEKYIDYVSIMSAIAREMTPDKKILISPYGTRNAVADRKFLAQLERLDVDIIAYQDEVGVKKTKPSELKGIFSTLKKVHDAAGASKLWANVEIFDFEGEVYKSALIPAPSDRVASQLEAVSPFVEKVLIYQYLGLLNKSQGSSFLGHPNSIGLYDFLFKRSDRR